MDGRAPRGGYRTVVDHFVSRLPRPSEGNSLAILHSPELRQLPSNRRPSYDGRRQVSRRKGADETRKLDRIERQQREQEAMERHEVAANRHRVRRIDDDDRAHRP